MQPFDALTIRAVLQEAKPLLLNRKVDKVLQLGRDEIVLSLRSKAGMLNLLLSAQTAYGRICLVKATSQPNERATGKGGSPSVSNFCIALRKHLTGATLIGLEQPIGERTVDFIFSCLDEVGGASIKILTAEIMGRHSNLIFWDKTTEKIICASHIVTRDMSRQREVSPGLRFVRPPGQDKANIFSVTKEELAERVNALCAAVASQEPFAPPSAPTLEQWLINCFTGLGRHLATEIVQSGNVSSITTDAVTDENLVEKLWPKISELQQFTDYRPAMKHDLSVYTVLPWNDELDDETVWKKFVATNDMVDEYYRLIEAREQFNQLKERLRSELRSESEKLETRINAASANMTNGGTADELKRYGDLVLANIGNIKPGQEELICDNIYSTGADDASSVTIKLNPNMSASQNAQAFYRQFAKSRARHGAATVAKNEATSRLAVLQRHMETIDAATDAAQLRQLKETLLGRRPHAENRHGQQHHGQQQQQHPGKKKPKTRLLSVNSSDGWTIYVGRNRQENDYLLSKLAQPNDLWLHILGQGGAHVLIRVPASKQDPPLNTIKEAAQIAARLSKAAAGTKVRVVYTQCKFVRKVAKEKPGVVRYENEKTLEVDTGAPMPKCMKQLFQS